MTKTNMGFLPPGVAQIPKNRILEDQLVIRERYPMAKDVRLHTMAMVIRKEMNEKTGEIYKLGYISGRDRIFSICGFSYATCARKWAVFMRDGYVHADHKYAGKRHRLPSVWYCRPEALKVTNQEITEPRTSQDETYFQVGLTGEEKWSEQAAPPLHVQDRH